MVLVWYGVAERMQPAFGVERYFIAVSKKDAARTDAATHQAAPHDPCPDRGGRVISTPGNNRCSRWDTDLLRDSRQQAPGHLRAFVDLRQPLHGNFQLLEDLVAPIPLSQVQEQCPGGI